MIPNIYRIVIRWGTTTVYMKIFGLVLESRLVYGGRLPGMGHHYFGYAYQFREGTKYGSGLASPYLN